MVLNSLQNDLLISIFPILLLLNFVLYSVEKISIMIKVVIFQGILLLLLPCLLETPSLLFKNSPALFYLWPITIIVKGPLIGILLYLTHKRLRLDKDKLALSSYHFSLLSGIVILILSYYLSKGLENSLTGVTMSLDHLVGYSIILRSFSLLVAIYTFLTGIFLMMTRQKAFTQIIGYLVLENGLYLYGELSYHPSSPWPSIVILIDLVVAIMIMGIVLHQIKETFHHLSTRKLITLKDKWYD